MRDQQLNAIYKAFANLHAQAYSVCMLFSTEIHFVRERSEEREIANLIQFQC